MMKSLCLLVVGVLILASCGKPKVKVKLTNQLDSVSYCLGLAIAKDIKTNAEMEKINPQAVAMGFDQIFSKDSIKMTDAEISTKIQNYMKNIQVQAGEKNLKAGQDFLEQNKKKPGVVVLPSGLQYSVIKAGTGPKPDSTDVVSVNYTVSFIDGKQLETTIGREPAKFPVVGVIKGWTQALLMMNVGSKWKLVVPAELAYGQGNRRIKPNTVLVFDMELLNIEPKTKDAKAPQAMSPVKMKKK